MTYIWELFAWFVVGGFIGYCIEKFVKFVLKEKKITEKEQDSVRPCVLKLAHEIETDAVELTGYDWLRFNKNPKVELSQFGIILMVDGNVVDLTRIEKILLKSVVDGWRNNCLIKKTQPYIDEILKWNEPEVKRWG